jgi:hypothetical protein
LLCPFFFWPSFFGFDEAAPRVRALLSSWGCRVGGAEVERPSPSRACRAPRRAANSATLRSPLSVRQPRARKSSDTTSRPLPASSLAYVLGADWVSFKLPSHQAPKGNPSSAQPPSSIVAVGCSERRRRRKKEKSMHELGA